MKAIHMQDKILLQIDRVTSLKKIISCRSNLRNCTKHYSARRSQMLTLNGCSSYIIHFSTSCPRKLLFHALRTVKQQNYKKINPKPFPIKILWGTLRSGDFLHSTQFLQAFISLTFLVQSLVCPGQIFQLNFEPVNLN